MISVPIVDLAGSFAENKDVAAKIRETTVLPTLAEEGKVSLDFEGVDDATQSFIHAIISESFRIYGPEVLESLLFKNCNDVVRGVIILVTAYMQESLYSLGPRLFFISPALSNQNTAHLSGILMGWPSWRP